MSHSEDEKWGALQKRWRRVASTHDLKELLRDEGAHPQLDRSKLLAYGSALVGIALVFFVVESVCLLSTFITEHHPPPGVSNFDYMHNTWYYACLVALAIPLTIISALLNWFSMKFFKHNS